MFRVTGLALNAIHSFVKWGYFLNEPGRATPWKQVHALYSLAEADGYSQVPFVLHAGAAELQALGAVALPAHADPRPAQHRQPLEGADRDRRRLVLLVVQRLLARHRVFDAQPPFLRGPRVRLRHAPHAQGQPRRLACATCAPTGSRRRSRRCRRDCGTGGCTRATARARCFPVEEHVALLAIIEKLYQSILAGSENRIEERTHFEDREVDVVIGIERVMRKMREAPCARRPPASAAVAASRHHRALPRRALARGRRRRSPADRSAGRPGHRALAACMT